MILIADSGSTKTEWLLVDGEGKHTTVITQGINPFFQDEQAISRVITDELVPALPAGLRDVPFALHYYGAGCSSESRCASVHKCLADAFTKASITVSHDLLAAARAACGRERGVAAILGTGSNSCLFDGNEILANNPSLGFIMGDEGSGGHIGKELLKMFAYRELAPELHEAVKSRYALDKEKILHAVYHEPLPNRYCASFMPFVADHKEHPQIIGMVGASFEEFFKRHITKYEGYKELPFSCVGSVGHIFREQLACAADLFGARLHNVIRNPMEGLVAYHTEQAGS